jgi:hydroxysqualene dehydroxylase
VTTGGASSAAARGAGSEAAAAPASARAPAASHAGADGAAEGVGATAAAGAGGAPPRAGATGLAAAAAAVAPGPAAAPRATPSASNAPAAYVLGGGVAGLTAAFGLAERGYRTTLLESRGWLGGRAFSSFDKAAERHLDNGPHAMLGCYRSTRALLRRLGTEGLFQQDRALAMAYRAPGGRTLWLRLSRLPVPLALPLALCRFGMPWGARLRALWGMAMSLLPTPKDRTLAAWLARHRQTGAPDAHLWRPLCRAIMNVEPEQCAAADFLATLREAFTGSAARAAFWLPTRPWGEVFGDPAPHALAAAGVAVRCGARVQALELAAGAGLAATATAARTALPTATTTAPSATSASAERSPAATGLARGAQPAATRRAGDAAAAVAAIVLADGERIVLRPGDVVVSALPWFALRAALPSLPEPFGRLDGSPIVSAYVTLAPTAPPLPDDGPVVALVDGAPFHFVLRTPGGDPRQCALLSGGDRSLDGQTVDAIAGRALAQLAAYVPEAALAGATVRVRKEQRATFVAAVGSAAARPAPGRLPDGPANLFVCGDWTDTGLPATLEGAARSAECAVAAVGSARG